MSLALLAAQADGAAKGGLRIRLPEAIRVASGQEAVVRFQILNGLAETVTVRILPYAAEASD